MLDPVPSFAEWVGIIRFPSEIIQNLVLCKGEIIMFWGCQKDFKKKCYLTQVCFRGRKALKFRSSSARAFTYNAESESA